MFVIRVKSTLIQSQINEVGVVSKSYDLFGVDNVENFIL